jgi:hypothetical protein
VPVSSYLHVYLSTCAENGAKSGPNSFKRLYPASPLLTSPFLNVIAG